MLETELEKRVRQLEEIVIQITEISPIKIGEDNETSFQIKDKLYKMRREVKERDARRERLDASLLRSNGGNDGG